MKKVNNQVLLLICGLILILFGSTYIFTRPIIWESFDFSETGQIGDTIGGITAPIINLVGAILVYLSFQTQINANKIQFKLLNQEIENQKYDRNFQVIIELFKTLKDDYNELKFRDSNGKPALNMFVNQIEDNWNKDTFIKLTSYPPYSAWKFLIAEYDMIDFYLESSNFRPGEKEKLVTLVKNYFITHLEYPTNKLRDEMEKYNIDEEIVNILKNLDTT